jgi:hypothetical protein
MSALPQCAISKYRCHMRDVDISDIVGKTPLQRGYGLSGRGNSLLVTGRGAADR